MSVDVTVVELDSNLIMSVRQLVVTAERSGLRSRLPEHCHVCLGCDALWNDVSNIAMFVWAVTLCGMMCQTLQCLFGL